MRERRERGGAVSCRPMLRRLFTILSVISLLLCVATCVLWVRSYSVSDSVCRARFVGRTVVDEPTSSDTYECSSVGFSHGLCFLQKGFAYVSPQDGLPVLGYDIHPASE